MITSVREERLLVVSDVHLGNPLFRARRAFARFLAYAMEQRYSVVINGDGVDIEQTSLRRMTRDLASAAPHFAAFQRAGLRVYYTVGNHDIALEHFLTDWGVVAVVPFLNVMSGDRRIRVEHGHLYDDNFVHYPRTYDVVTALGAFALRLSPRVFHSFEWVQHGLVGLGTWRRSLGRPAGAPPDPSLPNENPCYARAAATIAERGFDAVIFGHTHCPGTLPLGNGRTYYNTGSWEHDPHFAEIVSGAVTIRRVFDALGGSWGKPRGSWTQLDRQPVVRR